MNKNFIRINLEAGQAMILATLFFVAASLTMIFGLIGPVTKQQTIVRDLISSRQSYYLAEAGVEDVLYRLKTSQPVGLTEVLSLNGSTATTVTSDASGGKDILAVGNVSERVRKIKAHMTLGTGVSFHYGVQVGQGGFILQNSSGVNGNIYSNGNISGSSGAFVTGSVVSVGTINNVVIGTGTTGDAQAPTVTNSTIRGTLYCQTGSGNNKSCNTSQPNPTALDFPITDEQITQWKDDAALGGTFVGNKSYSGSSNVILGPLKIQGDLSLSNSAQLTLSGNLWVTGKVTLSNSSKLKLSAGYGSASGIIIVDGETIIQNSAQFSGSGTAGSYIMLLSTNNSTSKAIELKNNAGSVILYAPNGTVTVSNGARVKQITANKISLQNSAIIDYEQGLANSIFTSGPGGGYEISNWNEIE